MTRPWGGSTVKGWGRVSSSEILDKSYILRQKLYECLSFHPDDEDTQWDMFIKQQNGGVMPDTWKIVDMTDTNIILEDTEYIAGTRQLNCLYINYTLDNEVLHQVTFLPTAIPTMTPTELPTMVPTNVPTPVPTPGVTIA